MNHIGLTITLQPDLDEVQQEKRKCIFKATIKDNYILEALKNISSYNKMLRTVAIVFRFINQCRKIEVPIRHWFTPLELERALWCIVWTFAI